MSPIIKNTMELVKQAGKLPKEKIIEKVVYARLQQRTWQVFVEEGNVAYWCRIYTGFEAKLYGIDGAGR